MPIIANAGPLIALGRIAKLSLLPQLYKEVIVPPAVYQEVTYEEERSGAKEIINAAWIQQKSVPDTISVQRLHYWLDDGESEAIVLAQMMHMPLLIDERRGRNIAKTLHIPCVGTVGVLLTAKNKGHLTAVTPLLEMLQSVGVHLSTRLCEDARKMAGEWD